MDEIDKLVYEGWRQEVVERLTDQSALSLIKGDPETTLKAWHLAGTTAKVVADNLNRRLRLQGAMARSNPKPKQYGGRPARLKKVGRS